MKRILFTALLPVFVMFFSSCNDKIPEISGSKWASEEAISNSETESSILTFEDKTVSEVLQTYSGSVLLKTLKRNGDYLAEESKIQVLWEGSSDIEVFSRTNKGGKKSTISSVRNTSQEGKTYTWEIQ